MSYTATLYDKTGKNKLGELTEIVAGGHYVEEERNGLFEMSFDYPNGYPLSDLLINENMVEVKPNDTQGLQKFRIYDTKCLMKDIITVFARHESFDLANDHVENINLENASCEYALNTLFRNSHFSTNYRGYSDIINAQNYKIDNVNILNAIAGKKGSIIDTYGTGAEILRDGTDIHVLNKRGHDNGVTIEFGKNLTDFVLERDLTDLETRVGGFAKYTTEDNKEVVVKSNWIDSPYIDNFAHPYIYREGRRDYSDKFEEGEIPTVEKLNKLCADEFKINKRDIPKSNYTIKFIPLSKCVGYEGIQDKISLCDTVRIIDKRFNVDTKAKVIKYKYDFIKERYESMELGEPRTTLGDIITGSNGNQGPPGKDGKDGEQGPPGQDGNVENMPDTLPATPVLTAKVYGMGSVELSWTFENKLYYAYELYASRTRDFVPNIFDLIHAGQTSSFMFKANPGEVWYFKVCAINSHNNRTPFSNQAEVFLPKIEDMNNYFSEIAIGKAVVQSLSADYMEAGIIKGHWIDARNLSVTDGNGNRTLDINSFGKVVIQPSQMKVLIDDKVEFLKPTGERNMALYGGQLCAYNSGNNKFLSTTGSIIADNYNIHGSGFLLSKHCNHFLIGRDSNWDDIYTNRSPRPTYYLDIDFDNFVTKVATLLKTGDINMQNNNLGAVNVAYIKDWYGFGWKHHNTGQQLLSTDGERIIVHLPISFNGNNLMNPTLYTNKFYFTNGYLAFAQHSSGANVMMNGVAWDWQGFDIVNATLRNCTLVQNVANYSRRVRRSLPVESEINIFDEIDVIIPNRRKRSLDSIDTIGKLDVSRVTNKNEIMVDENNADMNKLVTLLFKEVKALKEEIRTLKEGV